MFYTFKDINSSKMNSSNPQNFNVTETIDFNRKTIQMIIEKKQYINYYWISASKLYNYINDDPILDWLNLYGKIKGFKTDEQIDYQEYCLNENNKKMSFDEFIKYNYEFNFMKYIVEQGIKYEEYVLNLLKQKYNEKIIDVENDFNFSKFEYDKKLEKTKSLIEKKIPIIYQGLVCDPETNTFGFPDFIIREDYLFEILGKKLNEQTELVRTEEQEKEYYNYYIIDVKYHSLEYKKDTNNLIPNPSQQQYISQLYLYTRGLRHLLHPSVLTSNILDHESYVIGRSWSLSDNNSIGCIDFKMYNNILEKVKKGLEWYKELKCKGSYWDPYNPKRIEMYPNMKNDKDNNWRKTKKNIAEKIGEITMLWNCGMSIKQKAHQDKVYSWNSPNFNIFNYVNDTETTRLINSIIEINNQSVRLYNMNTEYKYEKCWKPIEGLSLIKKNSIVIDGFIDIENTIDIKSIETPKQDSIMYMIGLYYNVSPLTSRTKKYKNNMTHKTFCVEKLDKINEKEIIEDFLLFLKSYDVEKQITWRLYHYSGVEKYTLNKLMDKYNIIPETFGIKIEWIDLCDLLIKYKFVFKGCFDYSIKSINKILNQLEYIPDEYIYQNSLIKNGLDTIIAVFKCEDQSKLLNESFNKLNLMNDISYYNMIDCISLFYLREFLVDNLCN
jgi:hypothetical protein